MTDYNYTKVLTIGNKTSKGFDIVHSEEYNDFRQEVTRQTVQYAKLVDDYIYKNIPTEVLQGMKLKIENELLERKLKDNDR